MKRALLAIGVLALLAVLGRTCVDFATDCADLLQQPFQQRPHQQLYPQSQTLFGRIDKTGKGYITNEDVDQAILDQSIKGQDAETLYVLKTMFGDLAQTPPGGGAPRITLMDLEKFHKNPPPHLAQAVNEKIAHARKFLKTVNRELYPSGTQQQSLDKMRGVHQMGRGNCYLLSGYGSWAAINPNHVRSIITDNGVNANGIRTYTVAFPGTPGETYIVEDLTEVGLLVNEVEADTGTWLVILERAYGQVMRKHPHVRWFQRWMHGLNNKVLPEDLTDEGSMRSDGLRLLTDAKTMTVRQRLWSVNKDLIEKEIGNFLIDMVKKHLQEGPLSDTLKEFLGPPFADLANTLKNMDDGVFKDFIASNIANLVERHFLQFFTVPRDPAELHAQLKHSIVDNHFAATCYKYGGSHEASIIDYRPGTVSPDGKHTSAYGFITVRDQAGLSDEELQKIVKGIWWREPGMDDKTICMSVEEFTAFYNGYASVMRRK